MRRCIFNLLEEVFEKATTLLNFNSMTNICLCFIKNSGNIFVGQGGWMALYVVKQGDSFCLLCFWFKHEEN
jgi:hypothetical protein